MGVRRRFQQYTVSKTPVRRGVITRTSGTSIYVSSPNGLREFTVDNPSSYKIGDTVRFQGSNLLGRIPSELEGKIILV